jgi:hypothetical protein
MSTERVSPVPFADIWPCLASDRPFNHKPQVGLAIREVGKVGAGRLRAELLRQNQPSVGTHAIACRISGVELVRVSVRENEGDSVPMTWAFQSLQVAVPPDPAAVQMLAEAEVAPAQRRRHWRCGACARPPASSPFMPTRVPVCAFACARSSVTIQAVREDAASAHSLLLGLTGPETSTLAADPPLRQPDWWQSAKNRGTESR